VLHRPFRCPRLPRRPRREDSRPIFGARGAEGFYCVLGAGVEK